MKRINLSVDLEDNEIFEKEVRDAIQAEVKRIARIEQYSLIQATAQDEIERLVKGNAYGYRDKLKEVVKSIILEETRTILKSMDIDEMVKDCVTNQVELKIHFYSDIVTDRCKEVLNNTVTKAVNEKLKGILG